MFWLLISALLCLNSFLYVSEQNNKGVVINKNYYVLEAEYSKLNSQEALQKATQTQQELSVLSMLIYYKSTNMSEVIIKEQINRELKSFEHTISYEELIEKYKNSEFMKNRELLRENISYINLIKSQLKYIMDYPNFIASMEKKAEEMKSVSIFNKPNSFAYRNIVKTQEDFEALKGIELKIGEQTGVVTATTFQTTDLITIALIFLVCIYLFSYEKENKLFNLVKANRNGRFPVALAKLFVLVSLVVFISILFYGTDLILGNSIYGFGDTSRYIQSMSSFRDCNTLMSIKEYLILFIITKIIVSTVTAIIFAFIFITIPNIKAVYAVLSAFGGVSYLCYALIHPASYINVLKYLNIFAFFNVFKLYSEYTNLNIFGFPIEKVYTTKIVLAFFIVTVSSASIIAFSKLDSSRESTLLNKLGKLFPKRTKISGSTSLFLQETYKIIIQGKIYLVIILVLFISYKNINLKPLLMDFDSSAYQGYINKLSGEINQEKIDFIKKEQKSFEDIPREVDNLSTLLAKGEIKGENFRIEMNKVNILSEKGKAFEKLKKQYEYLLKLKEEKGINGSFISELSTDYLFDNKQGDMINGLLFTIILIICISNIFPMDSKNGMLLILKATPYGRMKLFLNKYFIANAIAFFLMLIVYLPYYINLIVRYDIAGWQAPIQSIRIFENLNINISILGFVIMAILLQLITSFAMTGFILFMSQFLKRQPFVIFTSSLLFIIPFLVALMKLDKINIFTLNNGFTLFDSFTKANSVSNNAVYFAGIIVLWIVSTLFGAYRFSGGKFD
jgi:hypothetical protein